MINEQHHEDIYTWWRIKNFTEKYALAKKYFENTPVYLITTPMQIIIYEKEFGEVNK